MTLLIVQPYSIQIADVQAISTSIVMPTSMQFDPCYDQTLLLLHGDGNTIVDEQGKDMVLSGATTLSYAQAKLGYRSMYFDGTANCYVDLPNAGDLATKTADFTIECWVLFPSFYNYQDIYCSQSSNLPGHVALGADSTGTAFLNVFDGSTRFASTYGGLLTNTWYHIAGVRSGTTFTVYVNGMPGTSFTSTASISAGDPRIGENPAAPTTQKLTAFVEDFRISRYARYTAPFAVPSVPIVSLTTLDDYFDYNVVLITGAGTDGSTTILDEIGHVVTVNGNAVISSASKKYGTSSLFLDGLGDYLSFASGPDFDLDADFTIETWFNTTNFTLQGSGDAKRCLYSRGDAGGSASSLDLKIDDGGVHSIMFSNGNASTIRITGAVNVTNGLWHHVALVRFNGLITLYINGAQTGTPYASTQVFNAGVPRIGMQADSISGAFNGYIQDFRITRYARYRSNFAVPKASLPTTKYTNHDPYWANVIGLLRGDSLATGGMVLDETGQPIVNTGVVTSSLKSKFGGSSLYFSGTNSNLTLGRAGDPLLNLTGNDFTIELWANTDKTGEQVLVECFSGAAAGWTFYISASNGLQFYDGSAITALSTTILVSTWYHLAVVSYGGTITFFVNGAPKGSTVKSITWQTAQPVYIGQRYNGGSAFQGFMDEIRITKGVARYRSMFLPPVTALPYVQHANYISGDRNSILVDYNWDATTLLLKGETNAIIDSSSYNKTVTIGGNAVKDPTNPRFGVASIGFDGTGDFLSVADCPEFSWAGDLTIEMDVYFKSLVDNVQLIGKRTNISAAESILLTSMANGSLALNVAIGSATWAIAATNVCTGLTTNVWYHIALTRQGDVWRMFLNGTKTWTVTNAGTVFNSVAPLCIGGASDGTASLNGNLDEVRITTGFARYTASFTPPYLSFPVSRYTYDGLWASTKCLVHVDDASSTRLVDATGASTFANMVVAGTPGGTLVYPNAVPYAIESAVTLPTITNAGFAVAAGDFTVEAWVFIPSSVGTAGILSNAGATVVGCAMTTDGTNGLTFSIGTSTPTVVASTSYDIGAWQHLALTRAGGVAYAFKNGMLLGSVAAAGAITGNIFGFGSRYYNTAGVAGIYIGAFRFSSVCRYSKSFTPLRSRFQDLNNWDPNWDNVVLGLRGDGSEVKGKTVNTVGIVDVDNVEFKYGPSALRFSGTIGNYLTIPVSYRWWQQDFTIEFWTKDLSRAQGPAIQPLHVGHMSATGSTSYWTFGIDESGKVHFYYHNGNNQGVLGTTVVPLNAWTHLAMTLSGTTIRLFINGMLDATATLIGIPSYGTDQGITLGQYFNYARSGYIQDLRITKGVARYTSNFPVPASLFPASSVVDRYLMLQATSAATTISTSKLLISPMPVMSCEFWINAKPPVANSTIYVEENTTGAANYSIGMTNLGYIYWTVTTASGTYTVQTPIGITQGIWNHVVITLDANKYVRIYLNGVFAGAGTSLSTIPATMSTTCKFGKAASGTVNALICGLRGFRVYNYVLNPLKISYQYQGGVPKQFASAELGLVAGYNFSSIAPYQVDYSDNGNDFTLGTGCSIQLLQK